MILYSVLSWLLYVYMFLCNGLVFGTLKIDNIEHTEAELESTLFQTIPFSPLTLISVIV